MRYLTKHFTVLEQLAIGVVWMRVYPDRSSLYVLVLTDGRTVYNRWSSDGLHQWSKTVEP